MDDVLGEVVRLRSSAPTKLAPGVTMRPLFGHGAMLNLLEFEPGATVPRHSHPHEQLGYVLEGDLTLAIADHENELIAGDAYRVAGDTNHSARSTDGCLVLDVFQPVREDYRELTAAARSARITEVGQ